MTLTADRIAARLCQVAAERDVPCDVRVRDDFDKRDRDSAYFFGRDGDARKYVNRALEPAGLVASYARGVYRLEKLR